jgi:hypothetical protein
MPSPAQIQYNRANGLSDWYQPPATPAAPAAATPTAPQPTVLPDNVQLDGVRPARVPAPPQAIPVPDDFVPDGVPPPGVPMQPAPSTSDPASQAAWIKQFNATQAANKKAGLPYATLLPDDFQPDGVAPEGVTVTAERAPESAADVAGDLAENAATGVARVPGAIIGLPHMLAHTADWLAAHIGNTLGISKDATGADVDKYNPAARLTPSSQDVDDKVFQGASAIAGRPVHPYEPTTVWGKLGQAAITGAGAGVVDPLALLGAVKAGAPVAEALEGAIPRMAKTAVSASAANGAQQADPDNDVLPVLAALFTHTAAGVAPRLATAAGRTAASDFVAPLLNPKGAAEAKLGRDLGRASEPVDNTLPGIATPTPADITGAAARVAAADQDIGSGVEPSSAMQFLRDHLAALKDSLKSARSENTKPFFDAVRAEPPLIPAAVDAMKAKLDPGTFDAAANSAATDMRNVAKGNPALQPYQPWTDFDVAGDPKYIAGTPANGAASPDLLMRTKTKLNENAAQASINADGAQRTAGLTSAAGTVTDALDKHFPNTYPQARDVYTVASAPLSPFYKAPVARALAEQKDPTTGKPLGYVQNNASLFSQLAGSKDPGSVVNSFIDAAGNDKSVTDPLGDAVVAQLRSKGAIDPKTGEVNQTIYNREIAPYVKTLSMYRPDLMQKFGTAQDATATLGRLRAQSALIDGVKAGSMRDTGDASGVVTKGSFDKWLSSNNKALTENQDPSARMRLQQIRNALPMNPLTSAETMEDLVPQAFGMYLGGTEGAVNAHLMPYIVRATIGRQVQKFGDFYSQAIEKAVRDPVYAKALVGRMANKPMGLSDTKALAQGLWSDFKETGRLAPSAILAGAPNVGQQP